MYPTIVYRATPLPERYPRPRASAFVFTTPAYDLALSYSTAILDNFTGKLRRHSYIQEYEVAEGLKILDMNTDPQMPSLLEQYLGRAITSQKDYAKKLFHISEHATLGFAGFLESLGYDGFMILRPEDKYELLCVYDPSHLEFVGRLTVSKTRRGKFIVD